MKNSREKLDEREMDMKVITVEEMLKDGKILKVTKGTLLVDEFRVECEYEGTRR